MPIIDLFQHIPTADPTQEARFPGLVLLTHVIGKYVEIGATFGLGFGALVGTVDFAVKKRSPLVKTLILCELGVSLGCVIGVLALLGKAHTDDTMTAEGVQERANRLTFNPGGIKQDMDKFFLGGGLLGSFVCAYILPERWMQMSWLDRVSRGFCVGGALAALPFTLKVLRKMYRKQLATM